MLCIYNRETDPAYNLAAEEYMMKHFRQDIFMLWRNHNAIIVGKHQNTLAEINYDFVRDNHIKVIRRLSGGGTVFHDLGNINFTFIRSGEASTLVDFRKFTQPILDFLQSLGVEARFEGRNDLTIDSKKFSGNAEHVFKDRILHHGTLLFSSKMADLTAALKVNPEKFNDKAVKSVRSRVTNITDHLAQAIPIETFIDNLMTFITATRDDSTAYTFTMEDDAAIRQLVRRKYDTWEWNFGYSPKYNFSRAFKTSGGHLEVNLEVQEGIIREAKLFGDYFHLKETSELEEMLRGQPHEYGTIKRLLTEIDLAEYIRGCTIDEFLSGIF